MGCLFLQVSLDAEFACVGSWMLDPRGLVGLVFFERRWLVSLVMSSGVQKRMQYVEESGVHAT